MQDEPLTVVPLVDEPGPARLQFRITMGIRSDEPDWRHWLNDYIRDHEDEINQLLEENPALGSHYLGAHGGEPQF